MASSRKKSTQSRKKSTQKGPTRVRKASADKPSDSGLSKRVGNLESAVSFLLGGNASSFGFEGRDEPKEGESGERIREAPSVMAQEGSER